jgi:Holliday junction resolvase RusA-like endonuclease
VLDVSIAQSYTRSFDFVVPGEPCAKGRPRFTTVHGRPRAYTPGKTVRYEDTVRSFGWEAWQGRPLIDEPIFLQVRVYRAVPASWSNKKKQAAIAGAVRPTSRPDFDNYSKIVCDALNGVVFTDDALIVDAFITKRFSTSPSVVIELHW